MQKTTVRNSSVAVFVSLLVAAILLTMTFTSATVVEAQFDAEPTATPRDPIWLAFSTARDTVEESEDVTLDIVQRWDFFQDDWTAPNANHPQQAAGIDSCLSTIGIAQARPSYFGWTITITALNGTVYETRVSFDLNDVVICDIRTATIAPADDTDSEVVDTGDLPDPIAGSGATGGFELGGHVSGLTPDAIAAMNRSGMTWVKEQVPVSAGVTEATTRINNAQAAGFKILLGVVGSKDELATNFDGYIAEYAAFVAELAAAGADAIEIWNEPNIDREWPTGQVNGANYTQLLAVASNAIRQANPNTLIISGAPAPTGFFGAAGCAASGCNDDVFMQQMADAGAAQYFDCVGIHYNEGVLPPTAFSGDPRGSFPTYYYSSMVNRAAAPFPGKPICFTELGYLSGEGMGAPIPPSFDWTPNDPITVQEQAQYLALAASQSAQRGDVRLLIVWNVNFTRWDSDPMGGYAMIRPDGSCVACDALGTVMSGG
ncbi:MAG: hypothetical protein AAF846_13290 [Chloroflexota bacterium]